MGKRNNMIDEAKRKQLVIIGGVFAGAIVVSIIGFFLFGVNSGLPRKDDTTLPTAKQVKETPTSEVAFDSSEIEISGIRLKGFNTLRQKAVTNTRIGVINFYLAQYGVSTKGKITAFELRPDSIVQFLDEDLKRTTFDVLASTGEVFKVELSYVYSADAIVKIFNKDGVVVQTSPVESD